MSSLRWFVSASLAIQALPVLGVAQSSPKLTLSEAVQMAIAHSDDVRVARNQIKEAKAMIGIEAAQTKPLVQATGTATRFDNKTDVSLGGLSVEFLPTHSETLGLTVSQLLDISGQAATAVSQARLNSMAATYNLKAKTSDQALSTTTAYYTVLRAREGVKVAEASLAAYKEQLHTTTQMWQQGVGIRLDVLRSESQVADAEREWVRRQNDLNAATSMLNDQIGRPLDSPLTLDGDETKPTSGESSSDRSHLILQALDQRAEVLEASLNVAATRKGIKLAHADSEPLVSVGFAGNYYPTTSFQYVRHATAGVYINVQLAVLDGGLSRNRTRAAEANVDTALAELDQVKRGVSLQVQTASLDVETARKRWLSAQTAVKAADAARKLAQERYTNQVAQYLEVTDAQAALTSAQGAEVDAHYDLLTAQARLERALGDWALDKPETTKTPAALSATPARQS